ncbi:MAG: S9 family peptidase [Williamsia herbipolensis]|nr:S9 family peptidase [Williamsia herbipolensis]
MSTSTPLRHGSWPSPIDLDLITAGSVGLSEVQVDDDGSVHWLESRSSEQGRTVLVRQADGVRTDLTAPPFNVRNGVHEYGGGSYRIADGIVVFSHHTDGRLYVLRVGSDEEPRPLTPDLPGRVLRYADLVLDLPRRRVIAVREDHRRIGEPGGPRECVNTVVSIDLDASGDDEGEILVDGHDFVSSPRLSQDGHRLLWLTWEHPSMPWDSTVLWVGDPQAGDAHQVAGGPGVSIAEPGWTPDARPVWCTDETGWWNLVVDGEPVYPVEADCADPAWVFGDPGWAVAGSDLVLRRHDRGAVTLVRIPVSGRGDASPVAQFAGCGEVVADADGGITLVASFADRPAALVHLDADGGRQVLRSSVDIELDPAVLSIAEPIDWRSADGATSYGYLYLPRNPAASAPEGELPPLLVLSHGGPTASARPGLSLGTQFWTSRGFAVLDVDYGGSTGYGRAYRDRLRGTWGIVDVDDCCSGAQHLIEAGIVDGARTVIKGGSAGGYTTLAALAFRDTFAVGVSRYGVGDLEALATDTHKFESRYLDGLVGPYPQEKDRYVERSPIHHVDGFDCALLVLQGEDDKVVPPNQAISIADAVRAKGRPVALRMYPGEGHGFRGSDTIRDATLTELAFYGRIFAFDPADEVPDVAIDNAPH